MTAAATTGAGRTPATARRHRRHRSPGWRPKAWPWPSPGMRPDEQAAIAAVTAAQKVLAGAGHDLDPLTVAAALAAADTAAGEHLAAGLADVQLTGRIGAGSDRYVDMARETAAIFAAAAETYLRSTGAENYVEQHVTGRDGTRYVITFRRPDGRSADELLTAAEEARDRLTAAVLRLAAQLEISASNSNVLGVRSALRQVAASLRRLVVSGPG